MAKHSKPAHTRAAKMLGYCLTLGIDPDIWHGFTLVCRARLDVAQRAALAWAALRSLDDDHAEAVAETVMGGAGDPLPPFLDALPDAAFWADMATVSERKAYLIACYNRLSSRDQAAFLEHVRGAA